MHIFHHDTDCNAIGDGTEIDKKQKGDSDSIHYTDLLPDEEYGHSTRESIAKRRRTMAGHPVVGKSGDMIDIKLKEDEEKLSY